MKQKIVNVYSKLTLFQIRFESEADALLILLQLNELKKMYNNVLSNKFYNLVSKENCCGN